MGVCFCHVRLLVSGNQIVKSGVPFAGVAILAMGLARQQALMHLMPREAAHSTVCFPYGWRLLQDLGFAGMARI